MSFDQNQDAVGSMRLVYVLKYFPCLSQSFVLNEIRALEHLGHQVEVHTLYPTRALDNVCLEDTSGRTAKKLYPASIKVLVLTTLFLLRSHPIRLVWTLFLVTRKGDKELWGRLKQALVLISAIKSNRPDHLHGHFTKARNTLWLVNQLTGWSYSFTGHAVDLYVKNQYLDSASKNADAIITVCEFNRAFLIKRLEHISHRIHVVRPFLDNKLIQHEYRKSYAGSASKSKPILQIITVCRLVPKKGIDILIKVLFLLKNRDNLDVHVSIIGDGPERKRIERIIAHFDLNDSVSLLGACNPSEVHKLLQESDCFILPSVRAQDGNSDATPTVLGEAMASSLPVISTRISGIPEIVPPDAGFLIEPGDPEALAEAIIRFSLLSYEERKKMGARGRASVLQSWNPENDARKLAALFWNLSKH